MSARAIFAASIFLLAGCTGPRPEIRESRVERGPDSAITGVVATLENRGSGEGEVAVTARLIPVDRGPIREAQLKVELEPRETLEIRIPIDAKGGEYRLKVEARYPP